MLIGVNYHYIRESFDAPYPSIFGVTPSEFINQLDILGRSAEFLSLDDVVEIIDGETTMPQRSVVITFDDGFKEQFELAWPILKSKGIPAIFFINTKPIEEEFVTTTHKIHVLRAYTSPSELLESLQIVLEDQGISFTLPTPFKAREVYKYDSIEDAQLKYFLNYVLDDNQRIQVVDSCFDQLGFDEKTVNRDLYMTKDMVVELAKARSLGTHGHGHLPLGILNQPAARSDIDLSVQALRPGSGTTYRRLVIPSVFSTPVPKRLQITHGIIKLGSPSRWSGPVMKSLMSHISWPDFLAATCLAGTHTEKTAISGSL